MLDKEIELIHIWLSDAPQVFQTRGNISFELGPLRFHQSHISATSFYHTLDPDPSVYFLGVQIVALSQ